MEKRITVIGAGLAGVEAANQIAARGIMVDLYEMKPLKKSPAHKTDNFAELVCSNSLKAARIDSAAGLLKEEMRRFGSICLRAADKAAVAAGGALAVDRDIFSSLITEEIKNNPNITVHNEIVTKIPSGVCVIASGPLTDNALAENIREYTGSEHLSFYDAAAPIVTSESIDFSKAFLAARYGKGKDDYINCPMNKGSMKRFILLWLLPNRQLLTSLTCTRAVCRLRCLQSEARILSALVRLSPLDFATLKRVIGRGQLFSCAGRMLREVCITL